MMLEEHVPATDWHDYGPPKFLQKPPKQYVAGFLFSPAKTYVALIKKARPAWQAGKHNGIGGKIEPGETPLEAMVREFSEETDQEHAAWHKFAELRGNRDPEGLGFIVHFYTGTRECLWDVKARTDEEIVVASSLYLDYDTLPNVRWLVAMARGYQPGGDIHTIYEGTEFIN